MPKKIEYRTQIYDIGNECTVEIHFRSDKRPRMVHNDTQVVVGEGEPINFQFEATKACIREQLTPTERPSEFSADLEAKFRAIQESGKKERASAAEIAANGPGAEGALTVDDTKQLIAGLETAALLSIS